MSNIANLDLIQNNTSQYDINKSNLSTLDINKENQSGFNITRQETSDLTSKRINVKKIICILFCIILLFIIIGCSIFLIIFFKGVKKEDLIIENNKEENFVVRYFEIKNSTSYYEMEESNANETGIEQNNETDYNDIDRLNETDLEQNNETIYNDTDKLNETDIGQNNEIIYNEEDIEQNKEINYINILNKTDIIKNNEASYNDVDIFNETYISQDNETRYNNILNKTGISNNETNYDINNLNETYISQDNETGYNNILNNTNLRNKETNYYDINHFNETYISQDNETRYNNILNKTDISNIETNYNDIQNLNETYIIQDNEKDYNNKLNKTNYNDTERLNQKKIIQNKSLLTDFIVAINKKININEKTLIAQNKYLYETYLLIINLTDLNETDSVFLGGINIYNQSANLEELIKINNDYFSDILITKEKNDENSEMVNSYENKEVAIPFSKYSFFENGTLDKIYLPKYINEFYKSAMIDLINKVTPKLSKSIYNNETNKRRLEEGKEGTYLSYEKIRRNGTLTKIILYEETKIKDIDKNKDQYNFENSEMNSKIKRTFNSSGDMTNLEMEGEVKFNSHDNKNNFRLIEENDEKINNNLGLKQFKMNVTSDMKLIYNKIEKTTLEKLNKLSKMMNWELYDNLSTINNNNTNNNSEESIISKVYNPGTINFVSSYNTKYNIFTTSFLGLKLGMDQYLYIKNNTGLRKGYINLILGGSEITLSEVKKYHYSNLTKGSDSKTVLDNYFTFPKIFKPFGFLFKITFKLKVYLINEISFDIKNGEMYAKGNVNYDLGLMCSFGVDFFIVEFSVGVTGHIVKGNSYVQANTLLNIYPNWTKFTFSKQNYAFSVSLNFSFSIWLIFFRKRFETNIQIYKGIPISEYYYRFF